MRRMLISVMCFMMTVSMLTGFTKPVFAEGSAPVAENLELKTYRNVSVGGSLSAYDPDGDSVTYKITTEPRKGIIELDDNGKFIYTPEGNKRVETILDTRLWIARVTIHKKPLL